MNNNNQSCRKALCLDEIAEIAKQNCFFRRVVFTGPHCQVDVMSIPPGEDVGEEAHPNTDQLLVVVNGEGKAVLEGQERPADVHNVVFVTAGTVHNVKNTGNQDLKLFTIYAHPEHADGTVHKTKDEAMREKHAHYVI